MNQPNVGDELRKLLGLIQTGMRCLISEFSTAEFELIKLATREGLVRRREEGSIVIVLTESGRAWMDLPARTS